MSNERKTILEKNKKEPRKWLALNASSESNFTLCTSKSNPLPRAVQLFSLFFFFVPFVIKDPSAWIASGFRRRREKLKCSVFIQDTLLEEKKQHKDPPL